MVSVHRVFGLYMAFAFLAWDKMRPFFEGWAEMGAASITLALLGYLVFKPQNRKRTN